MFTWLAKRTTLQVTARELYGAVVAQAREPEFYRHLEVQDTAEGRYELVCLHAALLLDRLGQPDIHNENLRRELVETFVTDMDDSLREMGVGDTSVAKKVKKAAGGLYTRAGVYQAALAQPDNGPLETALAQYVYLGQSVTSVAKLATYVRSMVSHLRRESAQQLTTGRVTFGPPEKAT